MPLSFKFGFGDYFSFSCAFTIGSCPRETLYSNPTPQIKAPENSLPRTAPDPPPYSAAFSKSAFDKLMADLHQAKSRTGQSVKKGVPRQGEEDSRGERDRNLALDQILQKQIAADWARSEAREETNECLFFSMLPPEVRAMIYRKLLISPERIENPAYRVGLKRIEHKMLGIYAPVAGLDSTILRVCRTVYDEALPVLYGENTFCFSAPDTMATFKSVGLVEKHKFHPNHKLYFGLRNNHCGRLTLIRKISIRMSTKRDYLYLRQDVREMRKVICHEWLDFLVGRSDTWNGKVHFPVLESLELDFSEWRLGQDEGLWVNTYIDRLGQFGTGRMKCLGVRGIKHEPTLAGLREGLLRAGGNFKLLD